MARRVAVATTVVWVPCRWPFSPWPRLPQADHWIAVDSPAAAQLASSQAKIPAGCRGHRFARASSDASQTRDAVYPFPFQYHPAGTSLTTYPVKSSLVVLRPDPDTGNERGTGHRHRDRGPIRRTPTCGTRVIDARDGVYVLMWSPPPHTATVVHACRWRT